LDRDYAQSPSAALPHIHKRDLASSILLPQYHRLATVKTDRLPELEPLGEGAIKGRRERKIRIGRRD
jgi:hypothetical protein